MFRSREFRLTAKQVLFSVAWPCHAPKRLLRRGGWLGDLDSNQDCTGQSREFYR